MLEQRIIDKLETVNKIIAMPAIVMQIIEQLDNPKFSVAKIAQLIEQDQSIVARILKIANSPFYGFQKKISTVELAIIVLGTNSIKEVLYGFSMKRMFNKIKSVGFDIDKFWEYSLYCAAASKVIARRLGYKLAGEPFVAGLMHDIGILILVQYFTPDFKKINQLLSTTKMTLIEAEEKIMKTNHTEIGAWIAQKWNLPEQLTIAILNHHTTYRLFTPAKDNESPEIDQPLTTIVSIAEWFAIQYPFYSWNIERSRSPLYVANEIFEDLNEDIIEPESSLNILRNEVFEEYQKAGVFTEL
ncbi:MAG: HDOD domain-containing protein [Chloroherpetonaceae bacterium]